MRAMTFHEEASAEVNEAAKYYEERVPGLGLLFLVALEEAVELIKAPGTINLPREIEVAI